MRHHLSAHSEWSRCPIQSSQADTCSRTYAGRSSAPAISPWTGSRASRLGGNSALAALLSRDAERAQAAAQRLGAPLSYTSIQAIDPAVVDGVFLLLPNPQHAAYAIAAAHRHLHVIGEKP